MRQKNELARLLGDIVDSLPGKEITLKQRIETYIRDPLNGIPPDRRDIASARGNLIKTLAKDSISWKIFTRFLRVLNIKNFEMEISFPTIDSNLDPETKDVFKITVDLGKSKPLDNTDLLRNIDVEFANSVIKNLTTAYKKEEE